MTKMFSQESQILDWTAGTTGATAASGAIFDTDGFENIIGYALLESTNANAQLVYLGGTATDAMSEVTGPSQGEASGIAPRLYLDIHRPQKRYGQFSVFASAGGQNINVLAIGYGPRNKPTSNSTLVNGRQLYSPNSGTATATG